VKCSGCGCAFSRSRAPGLLCDNCWDRATMARASAAVPTHGRHAGKPRPLKAMTSYRNRVPRVPNGYAVELDDGVEIDDGL
jgi:hypothetical protein